MLINICDKDLTVLDSIPQPNPKDVTSICISSDVHIISAYAFEDFPNVKTIVIKNNKLKVIAPGLFSHMTELETVILPDSIEVICDNAFCYCESLKSIRLPKNLKYIGKSAFAESGVKKIIIPDSVEHIDTAAFESSDIEEIEIPNIKHMGTKVFKSCNLLRHASIQGSITTLPADTFNKCISLKTVSLSDSIETIEANAFDGCIHMDDIKLPKNLRYIGDSAFYGCQSLTGMIIPENVSTFDNDIFAYCDNLRKVCIKGDLRIIGNRVFNGCYNLEELECGNIQVISQNAFSPCENLKLLKIHGCIEYPMRMGLQNSSITVELYTKTAMLRVVVPKNINRFTDDIISSILQNTTDSPLLQDMRTYSNPNYVEIKNFVEMMYYLQNNEPIPLAIKNTTLSYLIATDNINMIQHRTDILTNDNIDDAITIARDTGHLEVQVLLTRYKHEHFEKPDLKL